MFFFLTQQAVGGSLGTIQARTHVQLALACQRSMICAQHRLRLTMQHVYGHTEIWVMNVPPMPLQSGHSDLPLATTLPPAGFVITLRHLCVLMAVTTSGRFWKDCIASEQMQRRYLKEGVSAVFSIGFIVFLVLLTWLSFPRTHFAHQEGNGRPNFVCFYRVELWCLFRA